MLEPVPKPVIYHHRDSSVWLLDVANKHSHGHLAMDKTERCCQRNRQSHSLLGRLTHLAPPDAAPSQPRLVFKSARGNYYGDLRWMGGMSHIHVFNKNNKHSCLPQKAPLWKWIYHRGRARQLRLSHRGCRCLFCWYFCRRCSHNDFTYSHSSHSRLGLRRHSMWKRKGFFSFFIYFFLYVRICQSETAVGVFLPWTRRRDWCSWALLRQHPQRERNKNYKLQTIFFLLHS